MQEEMGANLLTGEPSVLAFPAKGNAFPQRSSAMSSSSASTVTRLPNRDAALKALYDDVSAKKMFPFWATSTEVEHDEVKQLLATPACGTLFVALRGGYRTHSRSCGSVGHDGRLRAALANFGEPRSGTQTRNS